MNQDEQHLQLLGIFHYVVGGLTAVFALFPIIHFIVLTRESVKQLFDPELVAQPVAVPPEL